MTRFIMPIILIGIALTTFFVVTNPIYSDISALKAVSASYNEALDNSKALEKERDKLTAKYNSINPDNLSKLQKFLPENVDNIRLILEIERIALPYGMVLKDVKYSVVDKKADAANALLVQGGAAINSGPKDYGIFDLEFSTTGTYDGFISFTKDLEKNLRIVDIASAIFSSNTVNTNMGVNPNINSPEVYKYNFKIKTYWLKN